MCCIPRQLSIGIEKLMFALTQRLFMIVRSRSHVLEGIEALLVLM